MTIHRFKVKINCPEEYEDFGVLMLPDGYKDVGEKTRLVISCHGAGGSVDETTSQLETKALHWYLLANGFALMDVNGLPERLANERGINIRNNIGSPIAVDSLVAAYNYCTTNFNLHREVFVHGGSMGGISSSNLVLSGRIPVIAQAGYCPVLDTYNEIYLHPWDNGAPRNALGKLYNLGVDANGEYIYDKDKIGKFNPSLAESYPVPVRYWQCEDDPVVSVDVTKKFVAKMKSRGVDIELKTFPTGGHEPQLYGPALKTVAGGDCNYEVKEADLGVAEWFMSKNK